MHGHSEPDVCEIYIELLVAASEMFSYCGDEVHHNNAIEQNALDDHKYVQFWFFLGEIKREHSIDLERIGGEDKRPLNRRMKWAHKKIRHGERSQGKLKRKCVVNPD